MSKRKRAVVVLVLDQVTHVHWALPGILVRDGEVRSKKPPPADVLVRERDKWIRSWCSNDAEQVLETCRGADVEWESPSSNHRWNLDSQLAKSVDAVIHNWSNQT